MKDDRTYLLHILEAIEKIERYIAAVNAEIASQHAKGQVRQGI